MEYESNYLVQEVCCHDCSYSSNDLENRQLVLYLAFSKVMEYNAIRYIMPKVCMNCENGVFALCIRNSSNG